MSDKAVEDMIALLEEERSLLLNGKLEAVTDLESRKLELAEQFQSDVAPDAAALADLQQKAQRNQTLLEAALKGLKSATARLQDIRKATLQLDTYTRGGDLQNLRLARPKVERRA